MGTDGANRGAEHGPPWSLLGIAPTGDKAAIEAAYQARRAELDAKDARISAFADLTAARGKALFLAAELARQIEREGSTPEPAATLDPVAPPGEGPAEPEPEPEPEPEAPWQPGGRFASADDGLADLDEEDGEGGIIGSILRDPPLRPVEESDQWEHGGGYVPETEREFQAIIGEEFHPREQPEAWTGARPGTVFERYGLNKTASLWLLGVFLFLAFCSAIGGEDEPARQYPLADDVTTTPPTVQIAPPDPQRLEAMVDELFGEDLSMGNLAASGGTLTVGLVRQLPSDTADFAGSRALLRRAMVEAAPMASREQALAIAELRLAWLTTAQEQGAQTCRAVTTRAFGDGVPAMREDWIAFERSLAASLLQSRSFVQPHREARAAALPGWVFADAAERYAVDELTMRNAMADPSGTNRCATEIALLQALLERPDELTPAMLAAF